MEELLFQPSSMVAKPEFQHELPTTRRGHGTLRITASCLTAQSMSFRSTGETIATSNLKQPSPQVLSQSAKPLRKRRNARPFQSIHAENGRLMGRRTRPNLNAEQELPHRQSILLASVIGRLSLSWGTSARSGTLAGGRGRGYSRRFVRDCPPQEVWGREPRRRSALGGRLRPRAHLPDPRLRYRRRERDGCWPWLKRGRWPPCDCVWTDSIKRTVCRCNNCTVTCGSRT